MSIVSDYLGNLLGQVHPSVAGMPRIIVNLLIYCLVMAGSILAQSFLKLGRVGLIVNMSLTMHQIESGCI